MLNWGVDESFVHSTQGEINFTQATQSVDPREIIDDIKNDMNYKLDYL